MTVIPQSLSQPSLRSHLRAVWAIARKDWFHFWRYRFVKRGDQFTMPWPRPQGY